MQSSHRARRVVAEREVDLVRRHPERDRHEQQPVAARPPRGAEDQLHEPDQQQDVHRRVRRVDQPRAGRDSSSSSRADEEDPLHRRDRDRDDRRVEQSDPARVTAELAQQHHDREQDHRIAGEIEDVGDRRERRLAVEADLVDREDGVAQDLAEEPGGEQVPRKALRPSAAAWRPAYIATTAARPISDVGDRPRVAREERIGDDGRAAAQRKSLEARGSEPNTRPIANGWVGVTPVNSPRRRVDAVPYEHRRPAPGRLGGVE